MRQGGVPTVLGANYFTYGGKLITLDTCKKAVESGNIKDAFGGIGGGGINLYGDNQPSDIPMWTGTTVEDVTDYLVRNQALTLEKLKKTDRNSREIAMLPLMPQFRTTCRIDGDYTLTPDDVYKHFEDSVCAINDFDNRNHLYEVPLRALCRKDHPNIITAGRSASGVGYAWDLLRVIPPAIVTGQAAAEAACLAAESGKAIADVDIKTLQTRIEGDNVMVHFPDSYIPEGRPIKYHKVSETGHI